MMKIEFTLWDKSLAGKQNAAERQEILLYVERAMNDAWRICHDGEGVKIVDRGWWSLTAEIEDFGKNVFYRDGASLYVDRVMRRLHRCHRLYAGNDLFEISWWDGRA